MSVHLVLAGKAFDERLGHAPMLDRRDDRKQRPIFGLAESRAVALRVSVGRGRMLTSGAWLR